VAPHPTARGITAAHWGAGLMAVAAAAAVLALPGVQASVQCPVPQRRHPHGPARPRHDRPSAASAAHAGANRPDGMALLGKDLPVGRPGLRPARRPRVVEPAVLDHVGPAGASVSAGARQVSLSGRAGVLLVLATDTPGQMRLLEVSRRLGGGSMRLPARAKVLSDRPPRR